MSTLSNRSCGIKTLFTNLSNVAQCYIWSYIIGRINTKKINFCILNLSILNNLEQQIRIIYSGKTNTVDLVLQIL